MNVKTMHPPELSLSELRELEQRDYERRLGIDPRDRLPPAERQARAQREAFRALLDGYADDLTD